MATTPTEIQALYIAYFNRPAEPAGLQFWLDRANTKGGADFVANEFANSKEYIDTYGGKSNTDIVDAIYMNLFGRHAEPAGLTYWAQKLTSGELKFGNVARIISTSAQNADLVAINNKIAAASAFTGSLNATEAAGYDGPAANAVVRTWLTGINTTEQLLSATSPATMDAVAAAAGEAKAQANAVQIDFRPIADALTGTAAAEKFVAAPGTFNSGDTVDGGNGTDFLLVTENGALTTAGRSVVNVEVASLRATGTVTANTTQWTGLGKLSVDAAVGGVNLAVGADTAVTLTNVTGSGSITADGGKSYALTGVNIGGSIGLSGANIASVTLTDVAADGQADITDTSSGRNVLTSLTVSKLDIALGLRVSGDALTALTVTGGGSGSSIQIDNKNFRGYTLDVTLNGTERFELEDLNDNVQTAAFTLKGDSAVNLGAGAAQKITVAGSGQLALFEGIGSNIANVRDVVVTGSAGIKADLTTMSKFRAFDASAATGNNEISLSALQPGLSVKGGTGNDIVHIDGGLGATAVVALGAGNDYVSLNDLAADGAKVDGGAGTDTLALNDGAIAVEGRFSGFEVLDVAGGRGTYDMDFLAGVKSILVTGDETVDDVLVKDAVNGTTLMLDATASSTMNITHDVTLKLKTNADANSTTVTLSAEDGNDDGIVQGTIRIGNLVLNDMETISIVTDVTKLDADKSSTTTDEATLANEYVNELAQLSSIDVTTLNVSGKASLKITTLSTDKLTKVDAHALSGNLSMDASLVPKAMEFIGGSGVDTYSAPELGGTITGGAGGDIITLNTSTIGVDKLRFAAGDSQLTAKADGHDKIDNFSTSIVLDQLNLAAFGFSGARSAALLDKGALVAAVVDGSQLNQTDFFADGSNDRAVAFGTRGSSVFVFVDVDKNGNFNAASDLFIELVGDSSVSLANFVFV